MTAVPDSRVCGFCGRTPATGHALIGDTWFCHGDLDPGPTCYMRASWVNAGVVWSRGLPFYEDEAR